MSVRLLEWKLTSALITVVAVTCALSCARVEDDQTADANDAATPTPAPTATPIPKSLYVATGACYSGNGMTSFTNVQASNLIYTLDPATGIRQNVIADYYRSPANTGDSPVGIASVDSSTLFVLVENTTTTALRRIERVNKRTGDRFTFNGNTTALSAQLRRLVHLGDQWLLVSKSTDIEKVRDGATRITQGAQPFIRLANPPATSNCATSTTLLTDIVVIPESGLIVALHAQVGKTGFAVISPTGYAVAADCRNNFFQVAPAATTFPTAAVFDAVNRRLLVAYAGSANTVDINSIYAYAVNETTGAITSPQKIYDAALFGSTYPFFLFGISAMALDPATNSLYVATAVSTAAAVANYRIERLAYDGTRIGTANTTVLTKTGNTFYDFGSDTRCVSQMILAD